MSRPKSAPRLLETLLADSPVANLSIHDSIALAQTIDARDERDLQKLSGNLSGNLSGTLLGGAAQAGAPVERVRSTAEPADELPRRWLIEPGGVFDPGADYRLIGPLGRGGTGIVYQAHQRTVNREVAVKVLRDHLRHDMTARRRFVAEARTIGALDHPNVIAVHELAADAEGRLFYSMKRIDGTAWSEVLRERSIDDNLAILLRVADAIRYAHSRGIVHRDIKPANVMLGRYGEVLVADWGLAVPHPFLDERDANNSIGGTPAYMAPELASGAFQHIGPRTDVYLLGATLFELLSGHPPHDGATLLECVRHAAENRIRPSEVQSELMDVALLAMATDPDERYGTVEMFQHAIHEYQQHQESIGLVRRAAKHAEAAAESSNYERFSLAMSLVRESLELWPENRRAKSMLRRLRLEFAEVAAKQDDLDLALSLLESAGEDHSELAQRIRERRQQRLVRFQREARYSNLFANSPDAVLVTRMRDGTVLDANEMFLRLFEQERGEVVGARVADIGLWVCPERREELVRQIRETGRADNFETILRTRGGRHIPVLIAARRTELDGESLVVAHTRDITLRRAAEDELRRSRTRLREIQRLADLGNWEIDLETQEIRWSEETYKIFGLDPHAPPPDRQGYLAMLHPADREKTEQALRHAVTDATPYQLQIRHLCPDGSYRTTITRGQPIRNAEGRVVEVFGTVLDITDRKAREDRASSEIRRLQALLDFSGQPLLALERDGRLIAAAAPVAELLCRDPACLRRDWRFETDDPAALAGVAEATVIWGQFTHRAQGVGDRVRLRVDGLLDFLRCEWIP